VHLWDLAEDRNLIKLIEDWQTDMMVIPKAATLEHVRENRAALDVRLTDQDLAELDRAFPPQKRPRPLELL